MNHDAGEQAMPRAASLARMIHHLPWAALLALGTITFFALPWGMGQGVPGILAVGAALLAVTLALHRWAPRTCSPPAHARRWLVIILILGCLVRLAYVLAVPPIQLSDSAKYVELATGLLKGEGYHELVGSHELRAFRPPGYPMLLAAVMAIFGNTWWAPTLLSLLCFVLTALVLYDLTKRLSGGAAAVAAIAVFASWPSGIMSSGLATTEPVSLLLLLVVAWGCVRSRMGPSRSRWWLVTGAATGLGALVRPSLVPLPALLFALALLDRPAWRRSLRHAALASVVAMVCVCPWTLRNYIIFDELVIVSTNGGDIFYRANNPVATGGWSRRGERDFSYLLSDEVEWNRANMAAGKAWIRENPLAFLILGIRKIVISFADDSTGAYLSLNRAHHLTGNMYAAALTLSNVWWVGVWVTTLIALVRHRSRIVGLEGTATLAWLAVVLPFVHAIFESQPRYHMPMVGVLLCLSAMIAYTPATKA